MRRAVLFVCGWNRGWVSELDFRALHSFVKDEVNGWALAWGCEALRATGASLPMFLVTGLCSKRCPLGLLWTV